MVDANGIPLLVTVYPGIDSMGENCRIGDRFSVRRGPVRPGRGILLGDEVMLFAATHFVIGDLDASPDAGISLGNRVVMNVGCYISGEGGLHIEDDVLIGPHVMILSAGHVIHGHDPVIASNPISYGPISIGRGAWIGAGSTVLQGVKIGAGAVVGAGSVVTRDIPPFAVAMGNPAKVSHYREGYAPNKVWGLRRFMKW